MCQLLLGLAFTDFCIGLIVQPLYITLKFFEFINAGESLELLTAVHFYCAQYLCLETFVNVTLLSVDRFLALYIHLRYIRRLLPSSGQLFFSDVCGFVVPFRSLLGHFYQNIWPGSLLLRLLALPKLLTRYYITEFTALRPFQNYVI